MKQNIVAFKAPLQEKIEAQDTYLSPLLSIPEVCDYLGIGQTTLREMLERGEIPHIRVRSRIRISADDVREYLKKNKREGGQA